MENNNNDTQELHIGEALLDYKQNYTYADYIQWDDDLRRELIDGVIYDMSAPNRHHQKMLGNLFMQFRMFLEDKQCEVYLAPFDVRLKADTSDNTVVQPDLVIICDDSKLDDAGCKGVPNMVVEILSPSTAQYDKTIKLCTYQKVGVHEYWIIDPISKILLVNRLSNGIYITLMYNNEEKVPVETLEGLSIDLVKVFK